jgi:hypothetical protein
MHLERFGCLKDVERRKLILLRRVIDSFPGESMSVLGHEGGTEPPHAVGHSRERVARQ